MRLSTARRRWWYRRHRRPGSFGHGRETWQHAARGLGRVLVVDGAGPARQGGWGSGGTGRDRTWSAATSQGTDHVTGSGSTDAVRVDVETSSEKPWDEGPYSDWRLLTDWWHRAVGPGEIRFPFELRADRWVQDVTVEGSAHPFTFVGRPDNWVATGTVDGHEVTVSAQDLAPDGLTLTWLRAEDVPEAL